MAEKSSFLIQSNQIEEIHMDNKWKIFPKADENFKNQFPEISPLVLQLLYNRGVKTQKEIDEFLYPDYTDHVHDPFLFLDMQKAVDRIFTAILEKQPILVYGDYDADGVSSTAIMVSLLKIFGIDAGVYIPFREKEGYGMNMGAVEEIIKKKIELVITVDCGIANYQEVEVLKKAGIDVIITDHHNPQKILPGAYAIINPKREGEKYPTNEICGTAVAFKVMQAVLSEKSRKDYEEKINFPILGIEKWFLDLVAIGTVTDLMELRGESRAFVRYGLMVLNKTKRIGLRRLFEISGITLGKIDTYTIGFQIGPRLNAAGRMDHASTSYKLLISEDSEEVLSIAKELNVKNQERQKISDKMFHEAESQVAPNAHESILFAKSDGWSPSLVGLVAGKIMDQYFRPTIIMGKNQDGDLVGSGRSMQGFDVTLALEECKEYLSRFGGHSLACGFTVKDEESLEPFKKKMLEIANRSFQDKAIIPEILIDIETELHNINWEVIEILETFEPFGKGNPKPKILLSKCILLGCNPIGNNSLHLKGSVGDDKGTVRQIIGFSMGEWSKKLKPGDVIDIVCEPMINQWNGNREIQLKLVDMRLSDTKISKKND